MVKAVTGAHPNLTGLINNAGVGTLEKRDLLDFSEAELERQINTNLRGPMILSREIANYWLSQDRAPGAAGNIIIFITSVSSEMITPDRSEYCVSKAGLSMAAALFAGRLAESGIGVYEVRPGITRTDMTRRARDKYDRLIEAGTVPMKRWGTPEDVARAAASIISGDLNFSTGSVINVDGGLHIPKL
jgi:NAD(P)-dependent dehydrogenase (short-subunit alcohol dehydrogenase family)